MKKSKKVVFVVVGAFLLALSNKTIVSAYFDGDNGDSGGSGSGSCDNYYDGTGWCSTVRSWYYYEFKPNVDYGQIKVNGFGKTFDGLSLVKSVYVPKSEPYDCDKTSSGFYISGITLFENDSTKPTWAFNRGIWANGYGDWDGRFIGLAKYNSSAIYYNEDRVALTNAPLPRDSSGNSIKAIYAVPVHEVIDRWDGNDNNGEGAKKQAEKEGKSTLLSDYSYFCAGDKVEKQGQNYKGYAKIKVNTDNSINFSDDGDYSFEYSDSGNGGTGTKSDVITIRQGSSNTLKIAVESYGKVVTNGGVPDGYDNGYRNTSYALSADKAASGSTASSIIAKTSKSGTVADDYAESGSPASNIELQAGVTYTLCAINTYSSTYRSDASGFGNEKTVKACVKIKYEPIVAAIDSKTTLTAYGLWKEESDPDANGELDLGSVPYGAGAISATWSYNLSSSSRCIESYFDGTSCPENNSSIKSSFEVKYKRSGAVYDDSNDSQSVNLSYSSDYSSSDGVIGANTKNYNLLPGETIKETQGISHKSGVRTDGTPATNAKEESSSMTLKATAEDAICGLNNLPFGLGNPVNYGRMTVVKNKNLTGRRTYKYGDNLVDGNSAWSDAGDIWLKPTDTVQLSYEACIGEQIQKDKDSGNKKWDDSITTEYNAVLIVGTSNNTLDNTHYKGIGGAVDADSIDNKNIVANEKIGDTIKDHISNNYQFVGQGNAAYSDDGVIERLGQTITNDFGNISSDIHATMKIPYNYILEPEISAGTKEIVTLGNENTFTISVKNPEVRINTKVQNDAYQTDVKPGTKATYLKFAAKTDTSASVLASLNGEFISGDKTGDIASTLSGIDFKNPSGGNIAIPSSGKVDEETVKVSADESDSEYNKLCVAVAVYPADSHNLGGKPKIEEKDDQSAALTDSIDGGYTRIAVACKTVGKYPTTSVEGNGIVAGGNVTGAYTEYNNRYFGSWTEYSLIANSVQNFASGASVAYANPQTSINATAAWNLGGLNKDYFDSPQTLGNMSDKIGLRDEAEPSLRVSQMQSFVDDLKSTFFAGTPGGSETIMPLNDGKTFINTNFDGNVIIGTELANDINTKANEGMVLIYSQGDIKISNGVQYLKAVLIADGKVDTCFEKDQGGDNGQLLDYCYNPLVINGVVFSNKDIALDRVYGGGSTDGMNLDSNTLIQRAEIFNFNPEIVEWGYNYKHKTQPITTTYIEELSTRY